MYSIRPNSPFTKNRKYETRERESYDRFDRWHVLTEWWSDKIYRIVVRINWDFCGVIFQGLRAACQWGMRGCRRNHYSLASRYISIYFMPVDLYIKYCAQLCSRADTCRNTRRYYVVAVVDSVFSINMVFCIPCHIRLPTWLFWLRSVTTLKSNITNSTRVMIISKNYNMVTSPTIVELKSK